MIKIRTIEGAYQDIVNSDPDTAITKRALRRAVVEGYIPSKKIANKYMIQVENVYEYFTGGNDDR